MSERKQLGVVGVFAHVDCMEASLRSARAAGVEVLDVFSPVPNHAIEHILSPARSPVRFVTFTGGFSGLVVGLVLAIGTALVYGTMVGGKPVTNVIPFVIVGFELTILLGALSTFAALLLLSGVPFKSVPRQAHVAGAFGVVAGAVIAAAAFEGTPPEAVLVMGLVSGGLVFLVSGLFGAGALLRFGRGDHRAYPSLAYRPEFSDDRFGVWLAASDGAARKLLLDAGAVEVVDVDGVAEPGAGVKP